MVPVILGQTERDTLIGGPFAGSKVSRPAEQECSQRLRLHLPGLAGVSAEYRRNGDGEMVYVGRHLSREELDRRTRGK